MLVDVISNRLVCMNNITHAYTLCIFQVSVRRVVGASLVKSVTKIAKLLFEQTVGALNLFVLDLLCAVDVLCATYLLVSTRNRMAKKQVFLNRI